MADMCVIAGVVSGIVFYQSPDKSIATEDGSVSLLPIVVMLMW